MASNPDVSEIPGIGLELLPPSRCFGQCPSLSFQEAIHALLLGPQEVPPQRNDILVPTEDDVECLIYYCEEELSEFRLNGSKEVKDIIALLTQDEALALLCYTCEYPYPVYRWLNAWLVQNRDMMRDSIGPFFRLLYRALEKLPKKTVQAGRGVLVKDIAKLRSCFDHPPSCGTTVPFWGVSSFFVGDSVANDFIKGDEDGILYSCGSLECASLGGFSFHPKEVEVIPLPPAVFKVYSTMKAEKRKLVIFLDHDKEAHNRAAYVQPSDAVGVSSSITSISSSSSSLDAVGAVEIPGIGLEILPPSRCFGQCPSLSFQEAIRALLLGPKEVPTLLRNDIPPTEGRVDRLIYRCQQQLSKLRLSDSKEVKHAIALLTQDEALALLCYTSERPYPVYRWLNAWLVQNRRDMRDCIGPFFQLLYRALEKLPKKTIEARRGAYVRDIAKLRSCFDDPPSPGTTLSFWGVSSFTVGDSVVNDFIKGEEDRILYSCGSLECVSIGGFICHGEVELIPLPPAVFKVHSTMKVGERKLVISLDHDKEAHNRAAYVQPSDAVGVSSSITSISSSSSSLDAVGAVEKKQKQTQTLIRGIGLEILPPSRRFRYSSFLSFEEAIRDLLLGPKERNDILAPTEDDVEALIYRCKEQLSEFTFNGSTQVKEIIALLTKDEALALLCYTCEYPYPVYRWLNAWLVENLRQEDYDDCIGPFFRLLYRALEKLPKKTIEAVLVKDIAKLRSCFDDPPSCGTTLSLWGVSSFFVGDSVVNDFIKGEKDGILYSCGSLECASLGGFSFHPKEVEVIPLPPAVFKVTSTRIVGERKLVISLDHDKEAHYMTAYVQPLPPLIAALLTGNIEVAKKLLASKANVNTPDEGGRTPLISGANSYRALIAASQTGNIEAVEILLASNAHVNTSDRKGTTPLHEASSRGHTEVVAKLLASNADVNIPNKDGATPLFVALSHGHIEVVEILLASNANVNTRNNDGRTPLIAASQTGNIEAVEKLLASNAHVNTSDGKGTTPLHEASSRGHTEVVAKLLASNADVNILDYDGSTPLYEASSNGHIEVVETLLASNADVNIPNYDGFTPLSLASFHGHIEVVETLLASNAYVNTRDKNGDTPLFVALSRGHIEIVETLLASNAYVNTRDNKRSTPLFVASFHGHIEVVETLLASNAYVNTQDNNGSTPLHEASSNGHIEIVETLLASNADVNTRDNDGFTPLSLASFHGHIKVVETLLASNAYVNTRDNKRSTPLSLASSRGHIEVVETLLASHAYINTQDNDGSTQLMGASSNGHIKVVETLLASNADVNIRDKYGATPLSEASFHGHTEVVAKLLESNADVNTQDENGVTPLHKASETGNIEVVQILLASNADVNARAGDGGTPLQFASKEGLTEVVRVLLASKADINTPDETGRTPIYVASWNGHIEVVNQLLALDADINIPDKTGLKPGDSFKEDVDPITQEKILDLLGILRVGLIKCRFGGEVVEIPCKKTTTFKEFIGNVEKEWGEGKEIKYANEDGDFVKMTTTEELSLIWEKSRVQSVTVEVSQMLLPSLSSSSSITPLSSSSLSSDAVGIPGIGLEILPLSRCFGQCPSLSFQEAIHALLLGPQEVPPQRNDIFVPTEDDVVCLIYRCKEQLREFRLNSSKEVKEIIALLTQDEALALLCYTTEHPIPVYRWLNAWLVQNRRDDMRDSIGPFFRLLYRALEKLPKKMREAGRGVLVKDIAKLRSCFDDPPSSGTTLSFWGVSSFSGEDSVANDFTGGEKDGILYKCGSLECVSLGGFTFHPNEAEVIPLPPSVFKVHSTMKVGQKKLVISLDHDKEAHNRAAYVQPSSSP